MKKDTKSKVKLIAMIVVVVLAVVIFLQNTDPVEARILLLTVTMSRALLLILTFLLGLLPGILLTTHFMRRKR
jgi:uncharacterized integral membrane protein